MKSKILWWILGLLGMFFILSSLAITFVEYNRFNAQPVFFPPGSVIAGVPVGGLDETAAADRLSEYYSLPLALHLNDTIIHVSPKDLGFNLDSSSLVDQAVNQINRGSYWAYLWGHAAVINPVDISLTASVNVAQIRAYLNTEIFPRYIQQGVPLTPIPWTTNFIMGETGRQVDLEQAIADINAALMSPSTHHVTLQFTDEMNASPDWNMLEAFLRHNINWTGFDGLVEVYLESMDTGETLNFAVWGNNEVEPHIAFPAASTNKIPIMISTLRRTSEPTSEAVVTLFEQMIAFSKNPPADTLMSTYIDEVRGPLMVSADMSVLGMENTFLAGYFYPGAPLLQRFTTPANTRTDIFLTPDEYNQTTSAEAGQLLSAVYSCALDGSGLLIETFPGEITQTECQLMVDTLAANKIGALIEAGLPPGPIAAHKHGWASSMDGVVRFNSDVGIIFTPGGDYVLSIFVHDPDWLDFNDGNRVIARISQTVYNFFNIENQAHWWFD